MPSRPCVLLALAAFQLGAGGACAATNQLGGTIGFSNVDADIRAILGAPGAAGLSAFTLNATAQPPAAFSTRDLEGTATDPLLSPWSLDVEAGGATHRVIASAKLGTGFQKDDYYFRAVTSEPVLDLPAPATTLDVTECAGILRVLFVDEAGDPVAVQGDQITADSSAGGASPLGHVAPGSTRKDLVVRGDGSTWSVRADLVTGTDPFRDRISQIHSDAVAVACDEIVEVRLVLTTPGDASLGTITGRLDVLGEVEVAATPGSVAGARSHVEGSGPWRNLRAHALPGPPSEGAWRLESLVPSDAVTPPEPWTLKAEAAFGSGYAASTFTTPSLQVAVPAGATVDVGDAFVIDPVVVTGAVRLAGPRRDPILGTPLQEIWRASDRDGNADGLPDDYGRFFDSTCVTARGLFGVAAGATRSALGATGLASLSGGLDAAGTSFLGSYRVVLGNLEGEPGFYAADDLNIKLFDTATPAEPRSYVDERVDVFEPGPAWELGGGASAIRDRALCLSRVTVSLTAPGGVAFYGPNVTGSGVFSGTDFEGRATSYDGTLWWARGTPSSASRAATTGQATLLLPEGDWLLEPAMFVPRAGGGVNVATLPPFAVAVGCRQSLDLAPDLRVVVDTALEPCGTSATAAITGAAHADAGIATLSWRAGAGAPQVLCTDCGIDAPYSFDAPTGPGDTIVRVEATDTSGRVAAAEVATRRAAEPTGLRVSRDAGGLIVSWEPEPRDEFNIHSGTITALRSGYDHDRVGACGRLGGSATIPMPAQDAYLLVTSGCGAGEGSPGRDSLGAERSPSRSPCR